MSRVEVRDVGRSDIGRAAAALADAFLDDPVWRAMGPRGRRHRRLASRAAFAGMLSASRRYAGIVRGAWVDGRLEGAAIAFDGADWPLRRRAVLFELGWLLVAGPGPVRRGSRDDEAMRAVHPSYPHHYLWILGVAPAHQGRGLGRALVAPLVEASERARVPLYLETATPENLPFYGSLGFAVQGEVTLPSGPPMWLMERPAGDG